MWHVFADHHLTGQIQSLVKPLFRPTKRVRLELARPPLHCKRGLGRAVHGLPGDRFSIDTENELLRWPGEGGRLGDATPRGGSNGEDLLGSTPACDLRAAPEHPPGGLGPCLGHRLGTPQAHTNPWSICPLMHV